MSYTPNNWKPGDVLTAAKMNKLEAAVAQGGGGGSFKVSATEGANGLPVLDASYNDIVAVVESGKVVVFTASEIEGEQLILYLDYYSSNSSYIVRFNNTMMGLVVFGADTADALLEFVPQGT